MTRHHDVATVLGGFNFVRDESKNEANQRKHGISFQEAALAFEDENSLYQRDDSHSYDEWRFMLIGATPTHLLTVCYSAASQATHNAMTMRSRAAWWRWPPSRSARQK